VGEQCQQPDYESQGNGEDERNTRSKEQEKSPIAPGMPVGFGDGAGEQPVVAPVRFPENIEGVAENGDGSDQEAY